MPIVRAPCGRWRPHLVLSTSSLLRLKAYSFLLFTAIGWGLNWPATKYLLRDCPPLTARGLSGMVAAAGLAMLAVSRGESLRVLPSQRLRLLRSAFLNVTAWMGLTTLSMVWLPAGQAATLAYTMPVWTVCFARIFLGERLVPRRVVALALGLLAVALAVGGLRFNLDSGQLPGVFVVLGGAVSFALGTVLSKRNPLGMAPVAATAWQVGLGCFPLLIASVTFEDPHLSEMPVIGWASLAYTAIISLGLCYLAWFAALRLVDAGTATIAMLLTPIIGVFASAIVLGEALRPPQLLALGLVVTGVALASRTVPPVRRVADGKTRRQAPKAGAA